MAARESFLKLGHLSVRSLISDFDAVVNLVKMDELDLFALTETWLNADITNNALFQFKCGHGTTKSVDNIRSTTVHGTASRSNVGHWFTLLASGDMSFNDYERS